MWLPEVRQSSPAPRIFSHRGGVTPKPSAAFSTLATAKSIARSARNPGTRVSTARLPARPLTSPISRRRTPASGGVIHGPRLPNHADLHGARVLEVLLDARRDVPRQHRHLAVPHGGG